MKKPYWGLFNRETGALVAFNEGRTMLRKVRSQLDPKKVELFGPTKFKVIKVK